MNQESQNRFWQSFPTLDPHDPALRGDLVARPLVHWEPGKVLVRDGDSCSAAPLVLGGSLQVSKTTGGAKQIRLYSIGPGECCPLTSSCLLGGDAFPATVSAEAATEAVLVPSELFVSLVGRSPSFRRLVFGQFTRRLGSVIELVEALAFRQLDERLTEFLVKEQCDRRLGLTHQEIADRLGTSREVVSRLLKEFEAKGWLVTHRGYLELTGMAK
jgi:CRP/FNR family transcriptional regulator